MTLLAKEEDPVSGLDTALGAALADTKGTDGLIRAVVAFANGDISPPWWERAHETESGGDYLVSEKGAFESEVVDESQAKAIAEHQIEQERQFAADVLADAATGLPELIRRLRSEQRSGSRTKVRLAPMLVLKPDRVTVNFVMTGLSNSSGGWVLFAAALLGQGARNGSTDLGRCHLDSCRRFFLIGRGKIGKPQTKYCCDKHRLEQHALDASERQRRSRATKKAKVRKAK